MRSKAAALPLAALAVIALAGAGRCAPDAAPEFALKDVSGKTVRLADLRGQAVLLDFWATWCDSCVEATSFYESLSQRYHSSTFTVLGVDEGESAKAVSRFAKKNSLTYRVLLDADRDAFDAYRIRGLPSAVLIDASGKVLGRWAGFDKDIAAQIERAVQSSAAAPPPVGQR